MIAAMSKATIDSPRGKFTLSSSHNPVQGHRARPAGRLRRGKSG